MRNWLEGKRSRMKFAVPMIWREPTNHVMDCYFCLTNVQGFSSKSKHCIQYPNLHTAMRPVPHSDDLPVPTPPMNLSLTRRMTPPIMTQGIKILTLNHQHL